ncbi:MAG TPA: prolyl oligopeptidase family serine peptidase [Candidatus Nanopelagicales bacterium]|nr:prolyl oligopeptidase family serine peptidase [Candidatus Nanopelagicales bacterium]
MPSDLNPSYPPAPRTGDADELFGRTVPDPYRYLENPADPRTTAWSAGQAELLASQAAGWVGRAHWKQRVGDLLGAGGISAPVWRGERRFFMRRAGTQEHAVLLTSEPDGTERVLIDPAALDPSLLTTLDAWTLSTEGDLLAYQLSEGGSEESVLRVMDVRTGELVDGPIDRARYSPVAWLPGGQAYYYVRRLAPELVPADESQYHRRVWLHRVGTDPEQDRMVFGEGRGPTEYFGVGVSRDGRWLSISAAEGTAPRNDLWLADISGAVAGSTPQTPQLTVVQQDVDAQTGLHVGRDGRLYVFTDRDAPRNRLAVSSPANPHHDTWVDLLAEDDTAVLDGFAILDGDRLDRPLLLASWTRHAVSELSLHDLRTGERLEQVPLPGLGSLGPLMERPEGGHEAWFGYTDHVTVGSVQRFDALSGTTSLWANAPGSVQVPDVRTAMVEYPSADGTIVRMFVLSPAAGPTDPAAPDRPRPAILYGYGGFGLPLTPAYSATILAWVEAGGVYAIAGIRGGGEEGEGWHRDGMLAHKQHSFDDFHAAAEWLVAAGFTTSEQLAINGGSNGGLLVGAALTQRPELFAAVVCSAPLLDMVRYEKFGLGATWNVEYGSADDPEQLGWLLSYSPYHQVRDGVDYPAVLFTVFDADSRVDPMHARKMAAALQHATASPRPILIRAEGDVGHGARALSRSVELSADMLAFTARWTGMKLD